MTPGSGNEQDMMAQSLRDREREVRSLEESVKNQQEMLQNLNTLLEQSDLSISVLTALQHLYSSGQSVREMTDEFLELACKASRCEAGVLALREGDAGHLRVVAAIGDRKELVRQYVFGEGEGLMGEVARTGDPLLVPDARREPRLRKEGQDFIQREARNALCVPVVGTARTWGSMLLVNTLGRKRFNRQDIDLQNLLALRLGRELDREAESAQVREDASRFSTLLRITELLYSTQDPQKVYDLVIQLACRLAKAQAAAIYISDETRQMLTCVASSLRTPGVLHVDVGSGVAGWVAFEGQPVNVIIRDDSRFVGLPDPAFPFPVETALAVPISGGQRVNGVLQVVNKLHRRKFDDSDQSLIGILAREAGIALERLHQISQDQRTIMELLRGLGRLIDSKAAHLIGHSERVAKIGQTIGEEMGMGPDETARIYMAGLLHDLGNLGVDDEVFIASRPMNSKEIEQMRSHPAAGAQILRDVTALRNIAPGALYHHERYDGSGYPHGLKGESIPIVARILAVAEAFDAMRATRPYRPAMDLPKTMATIRAGSGSMFDPKAVDALVAAYQKGKLPA